ncbi:Imm1 family immunity protein [Streptomyces sp. AK02-01A]|uniref:Imm1 family immunity protein n=1 Tax=Streptomyces sp. AK02-01A TaxID=3028648 RepID=UPI0029B3D1B8|nr:Imm1 family immunity protein [Streptomyces sp. AK02-01A]MDX3854368.1 Imm1 family immunity protein [Streptomyces sp. AK02-01A]
MALKVLGQKPIYLKNESEVCAYLDAFFAVRDRLDAVADFQIVADVAFDESQNVAPDNVLSIGIDDASGYGGLIWYCDGSLARQISAEFGHDLAYSAWVSLSSSPPDFDPEVVSEPGCPTFFDRTSVLPLPRIRSVVEEYFREGTGFRPTQVQWMKGHYTGEIWTED